MVWEGLAPRGAQGASSSKQQRLWVSDVVSTRNTALAPQVCPGAISHSPWGVRPWRVELLTCRGPGLGKGLQAGGAYLLPFRTVLETRERGHEILGASLCVPPPELAQAFTYGIPHWPPSPPLLLSGHVPPDWPLLVLTWA